MIPSSTFKAATLGFGLWDEPVGARPALLRVSYRLGLLHWDIWTELQSPNLVWVTALDMMCADFIPSSGTQLG